MGDTTRGLYPKFYVERTDGQSEPDGKHEGCDYFVLDLSCDPHALPALVAYRDSLKERGEYEMLARDLGVKIEQMIARSGGAPGRGAKE